MAKYDGVIYRIVSQKGSIFLEEHGYFYKKYNKQFLIDNKISFIQEYISKSSEGTIGGLHWQTNPLRPIIGIDWLTEEKTISKNYLEELSPSNVLEQEILF